MKIALVVGLILAGLPAFSGADSSDASVKTPQKSGKKPQISVKKEKNQMAAETSPLLQDPALRKLSECVGSKWAGVLHGDQRDLKTEFTAEWAMNHDALRFRGVIDKDGPIEFETESLYSWDSVNKKAYYIDFHGPDDVYKGSVRLNGEVVEQEFERIVGTPAIWKSTLDFHVKNTMVFTLYTAKDGGWEKWKSVEYHKA